GPSAFGSLLERARQVGVFVELLELAVARRVARALERLAQRADLRPAVGRMAGARPLAGARARLALAGLRRVIGWADDVAVASRGGRRAGARRGPRRRRARGRAR